MRSPLNPDTRVVVPARENAHLAARARLLFSSDAQEGLANEAGVLFGCPLEFAVRAPIRTDESSRRAWAPRACVAAVFHTTAGNIVLDVDPFLAACAVDRTLGGEGGSKARFSEKGASDFDRGVIAYVLARLAARTLSGSFSLAAVVRSHDELVHVIGDGHAWVWEIATTLGGDRGPLRVIVPEPVLHTLQPTHASKRADEEVECAAVVGEATLLLSELASLALGDAIVLDNALRSEANVHTLTAVGHAWRCDIVMGDLRVKEALEKDPMTTTKGERALTHGDADTVLDVSLRHTQDIPVTMSAEVARFLVPYVELASLKVGDVVKTGRPVSDQVVLRAGSRAIASGRLIEFEGSLAVQITTMHTAKD